MSLVFVCLCLGYGNMWVKLKLSKVRLCFGGIISWIQCGGDNLKVAASSSLLCLQ